MRITQRPVFGLVSLIIGGAACGSTADDPNVFDSGQGTGQTQGSGGTTGANGTGGSGGNATGASGSGGVGGGGPGSGGTSGSGGSGGSSGSGGSGGTSSGSGGSASDGGSAGSGGSKSDGGSKVDAGKGGSGGSGGSGGTGSTASCTVAWPQATGTQNVSATIKVSGTMDGALKKYVGTGNLGGGGQNEGQDPMFELSDGATLKNVILGSPAADGVHCQGSCTLENVWWEDVGEDAATLLGSSSSQTMTINGGGAKAASDKVFQHNGPGNFVIKNFYVSTFGKLYRSCGNCSKQYARHVTMDNIIAITPGSDLAGMNANYGDTAKFTNITACDKNHKLKICERYTGNSTGAEPSSIGNGADGKTCIYADSDITWVAQ